MAIPVGQSAELFSLGAGASLSLLLGHDRVPLVTPYADLSYTFLPLSKAQSGDKIDSWVSLLRIGVGTGTSAPLTDILSIGLQGGTGFYAGFLQGPDAAAALDTYTGHLFLRAGANLVLSILPNTRVYLSGGYTWYGGFVSTIEAALGVSLRISGQGGGIIPRSGTASLFEQGNRRESNLLGIRDAEFQKVFPVLYKHYEDHSFGRVTVINESGEALNDIEVRLEMQEYINDPMLSTRIESLAPGQSRSVDIYALFNDQVLTLTEGDKLTARIACTYSVGKRRGQDTETVTVQMYDRNALRWDDDDKIGAFITAKDEEILRFAKNVMGVLEANDAPSLSGNLKKAVAIWSALKLHGLTYTVDPSSSYAELSKDRDAVDYVQFPRQTLLFKAGDCDDLTATFCALLESVGVPTAFITIPGHIYAAFALDMIAEQAARTFSDIADLIVEEDGQVWLPLEVTLLGQDFLQIWATGARQWRSGGETAKLHPVSAAWARYDPVAFNVADFKIEPPARADVRRLYESEMRRLTARQIGERERSLLAVLEQRPRDPKALNKLGVLYARYGDNLQAERHFKRAVSVDPDFAPALVNLGNLEYLAGNYDQAREHFASALKRDPDNARILLSLAKTHYELENYGTVRKHYQRIEAISPELADRFSYLGFDSSDPRRAVEAGRHKYSILWLEQDE